MRWMRFFILILCLADPAFQACAGEETEPPTVETVLIPGRHDQPGGPSYDFRIGRYEITNAQFAAFLNDALINLDNERGAFLYHDLDSADVYIHSEALGTSGTDGAGTFIFDASVGAAILVLDDQYFVVVENENKPVVGVTWYGALKYCNWLTLNTGMDPAQRAYTEGPNRGDWHPVTISTLDWWGTVESSSAITPAPGARDLNNAERAALVADFAGFRLPMDHGALTASAYNEWYKAAAWHDAAGTRTLTFDPSLASPDGASTCDVEETDADAWWRYTPETAGTMSLTWMPPSIGQLNVSVHDACRATACGQLACKSDGNLSLAVTADRTYYIRIAVDPDIVDPIVFQFTGPGCADSATEAGDACTAAPAVCPDGKNTLYGFGRDSLTGGDANYFNSGDPFDNGLTPVGFFDGHAVPPFTTNQTANAYGLYDISGNAREWMQDRATDVRLLGTRGGHWQLATGNPQLDNIHRDPDFPHLARSFNGFRVAQAGLGPPLEFEAQCDVGTHCRASYAPIGGPYDPDFFAFATTNPDTRAPHAYSISTVKDWLALDAETEPVADAGSIAPGGETTFDFQFGDTVATLTAPPEPPILMADVPARAHQPGGPEYSFRVATFETTNEEFARFLNDARAKLAQPAGQFMYFDNTTGDVYINTTQTGQVGDGADGRTVPLFRASDNPRIIWNAEDVQYEVTDAFENHPVVGVSWYGAVKYCNWLTLHAGLPASARAYTEGPHIGDWHPATITTCNWWGTSDTGDFPDPHPDARDLNSAEQLALVNDIKGFRLPMDADPYNEWLRLAGWNTATQSITTYGFGRDSLSPAAANYYNSADPFDGQPLGTTPVGFFNGTLYNADGSVDEDQFPDTDDFDTLPDDNTQRLYDLSGNVAEWTQQRILGRKSFVVRGGSWRSSPSDLTITAGLQQPADMTARTIGFRVVQAALDHRAKVTLHDTTVDRKSSHEVRLLLREPIAFTPKSGLDVTGIYGGPLSAHSIVYNARSESAADMNWSATFNPPAASWLLVNGMNTATGTLTPDASEQPIEIALKESATLLTPGEYATTATFHNTTTGYATMRSIKLSILEPITAASLAWEVPGPIVWSQSFDAPQSTTITLENSAILPIDYHVTTPAQWLTLSDADDPAAAAGTLPAVDDPKNEPTGAFTISTNAALASLTPGTYETQVTIHNDSAGSAIVAAVTLEILDPLHVSPNPATAGAADFTWSGCIGGPFAPDNMPTTYTLENIGGDSLALQYEVTTDAPWLDVTCTPACTDSLLTGFTHDVTLTLNEEAEILNAGIYDAQVIFNDISSGGTQTRTVRLHIFGDIALTPLDGLTATAREGELFLPPVKSYALAATADLGSVNWSVTLVDSQPPVSPPNQDGDWIRVSGKPIALAGGSLLGGEMINIGLSLDPTRVATLTVPEGVDQMTWRSTIAFTANTEDPPLLREVELTVVRPQADSQEILMPKSIAQPGGPQHSFAMTAGPVTNAEFVQFLNDALEHLDDPRGAYLYVDTATGDVYVNEFEAGGIGSGPNDLTKHMFSPPIGGAIMFDGTSYAVVTAGVDRTDHPVVGVTWYGAAKYCNWLTLDQGYAPDQRCYIESDASALSAWRPAPIAQSPWNTRDLNNTERATLVNTYRGYRLPMDDGYDNADPGSDGPDIYNEWYLAAAWHPVMFRNSLYGFGGDVISGAAANYLDSGDAFDNGTTPVGHYPANPFGFLDLSGNTWEWMQDRFVSTSATINRRVVRGGSWNTGPSLLRNDLRVWSNADATSPYISFRVVRAVPATATFDADADADTDLADLAALNLCLKGPNGQTYFGCEVFDGQGDADVDLEDIAQALNTFTGP